MPSNRGSTSLKRSRPARHPMQEFDALPDALRTWTANAMLPWRSKSVKGAYDKAFAETGDTQAALDALDRLQRKLVAKDASRVWGDDHPDANLA